MKNSGSNLLLLLGLLIYGCNPSSQSLPDEEPVFEKGNLLYQNEFSKQEDLIGWKMEGPGEVSFMEEWMYMKSVDEEFHHVFWCPEDFPESFIAEWEAQNMETDAGLCIIFFSAKGDNTEDIFHESLPKRDGTFRLYTKGRINTYHISYYANNPELEPGRGTANLRKNSGAHLVQVGKEGIETNSQQIHSLQLKPIPFSIERETLRPFAYTVKRGFSIEGQCSWLNYLSHRIFYCWAYRFP